MLPLVREHRNLPGLFEEFFGNNFLNDFLTEGDWSSAPSVNVVENDNDYQISVAAPGLDKEDFKVDLKNNVLTISSEKKCEKEDKKKNYLKREFCYNGFSRSFSLPENIDTGKISAEHKNGILSVVLPKKAEAQPVTKQIDIE